MLYRSALLLPRAFGLLILGLLWGRIGLAGEYPTPTRTAVGIVHLTGLAVKDPIPMGDFNTLTIPIKRAHNLILLEGTIDSLYGNFILDFGSPYLVLNATYFRDYRTDYGRLAASANGVAGYARRTGVQRLSLGGLTYEDLDADVTELGNIENKRGVRILGLLGVNLFKEFEMELDLKQSVIILHRLDKSGYPVQPETDLDVKPEIVMPIQVYNNIILLDANIADKKLRFALDSGAEVNLLDKDANRKVLSMMKINRTTYLNGSTGGRVEVIDGVLLEMEVGGVRLKNMRTLVTDLSALGEGYGVPIEGMLGYGFLSQGIVWINFDREELRILLYKEQAE